MSKRPPDYWGPASARRSPSFRGRYIIYQWRGQTKIRSWPRPRGKAKTEKQQAWQDMFSDMAAAIKEMHSTQIVNAIWWTQGTQWLWRDYLWASHYGTLLNAIQTELGTYWNVSFKSDATFWLDSFSPVPKSILTRGTNNWAAVPPGAVGDILKMMETGPRWTASPPPSSTGEEFLQPKPNDPGISAPGSGGNNFIARPFEVAGNLSLTGLKLPIRTSASTAIVAGVYDATLSGGNLTGAQLIAASNPQAPSVGAINTIPFIAPVDLVPGERYWAGIWINTGNVFLANQPPMPFRFFSHSTSILPDPAPASTGSGPSAQFSCWGY